MSEALVDAQCAPVDWGCADEAYVEDLDPTVKLRSEALAWLTLRSLTAYQVGDCPITVRPCDPGCGTGRSTWVEAPVVSGQTNSLPPRNNTRGWWPHIDEGGNWVNTSCGCTTPCSCTYVPQVELPGPVGRVDAVTVDGVALDPTSYRVDNANQLVRVDGGHWPRCQDMAADCDEVGTFCVTYVRGHAASGLASYIAGVLALEYSKACTGGKCRLPSGVTQVVRNGLTFEMGSEAFENGLTGIREVDNFVAAYNPYHLKSAPQIWSPDMTPTRTTTWRARR